MKALNKVLCVMAVVLLFVGCGTTNDGERIVVTNAYLNCNSVAKGYDTSCGLILSAPIGTTYTASVVSDDDWCLLTNDRVSEVTETMRATETMQWVKFTQNFDEIRYATITVVFDNGYTFELPLRQTVFDAPESYDKPWNELPKYVPNENYIYRTHTSLLQNTTKRNYTFCFDKSVRASLWVAYPMHTCYTAGDANRNNSDFGFDPTVETIYQANLVGRSYTGPFDRGHQIPAADRKCTQAMMNQTFYATNMTPQYSKFNQHMWGYLEGKVRNMVCPDTLYVVTGAYFKGPYDPSIEQLTDGKLYTTDGTRSQICPIPSHYFKILLRTVKGNTGRSVDSFDKASDLQAIGIWLQHKDTGYDVNLPAGSVVPVSKIEELTGFEFFNMLNPDIAAEVKQQCNPSAWAGL